MRLYIFFFFCLRIKRRDDVTAVVGTNSWRGQGGTVYRIGNIVQHEDYVSFHNSLDFLFESKSKKKILFSFQEQTFRTFGRHCFVPSYR